MSEEIVREGRPESSGNQERKLFRVKLLDPTFSPLSVQLRVLEDKGIGLIATFGDENGCTRELVLAAKSSEELTKLNYKPKEINAEELDTI